MTKTLDEAMRRAIDALDDELIRVCDNAEVSLGAHVLDSTDQCFRAALASLAASGWVLVPVTVISQPNEPGQYVGDTWFGHPQDRTLPTHWWDGNQWVIDHSPAAPKPGDKP